MLKNELGCQLLLCSSWGKGGGASELQCGQHCPSVQEIPKKGSMKSWGVCWNIYICGVHTLLKIMSDTTTISEVPRTMNHAIIC